MKLHPELIDFISESIINDLLRERLVKTADREGLQKMVGNIIVDELDKVSRLDDEVREILAKYYQDMRAQGVSYDEMFRKVKSRLAAERGIVL